MPPGQAKEAPAGVGRPAAGEVKDKVASRSKPALLPSMPVEDPIKAKRPDAPPGQAKAKPSEPVVEAAPAPVLAPVPTDGATEEAVEEPLTEDAGGTNGKAAGRAKQ